MRMIIVLCWLVLLGGCTTQPKWEGDLLGITELQQDEFSPLPQSLPPTIGLERPPETIYRIGPLDELVVTVWGREDLGSQIREDTEGERRVSLVQEDGTLQLPFIQPFKVSGMTVEDAQEIITSSYAKIVKKPQVEVRAVGFFSKPVYLEGAMRQPGIVYLSPDVRTLADVIAEAGGLQPEAAADYGILVRQNKRVRLLYLNSDGSSGPATNIRMQAGDWVQFPFESERVVYIFGEVGLQRKLPIPTHGIALIEAIADVNGYDRVSANLNQIFLLRQSPQGSRIYRITMAELLETPDTELQPGDRLMIPPTGLANWDRTWRQLLPFASIGDTGSNIYRTVTVDN